jgi:hypothetical protein
MSRSALGGRTLVQHKGLEYSVIQLADGTIGDEMSYLPMANTHTA